MARVRQVAGLELQPNVYTCGPCALRHALLAYSVRASVRRLGALADTTYEHGTHWTGLAQAATHLGFRLGRRATKSKRLARSDLRKHLAAGVPVILPVDKDELEHAHWIAAVKATAKHVFICDSSNPGPVLKRITWARLLWRMMIPTVGTLKPTFISYPLLRAE